MKNDERIVSLIKTHLPGEFSLVGSATVRAIVAGGARFETPEASQNLDLTQTLQAIAALAVFANSALQVADRVRAARKDVSSDEVAARILGEVERPTEVDPEVAGAVTEEIANDADDAKPNGGSATM